MGAGSELFVRGHVGQHLLGVGAAIDSKQNLHDGFSMSEQAQVIAGCCLLS
jgi:hypothetical protein